MMVQDYLEKCVTVCVKFLCLSSDLFASPFLRILSSDVSKCQRIDIRVTSTEKVWANSSLFCRIHPIVNIDICSNQTDKKYEVLSSDFKCDTQNAMSKCMCIKSAKLYFFFKT
uniref:Uncharacterized protein n=2 Tax=Cacopsylla melanoneura TaxID=428564 RepID=A0A8D8VP86_9HEMI